MRVAERAAELSEHALRGARRLGDLYLEASARLNLGVLAAEQRAFSKADVVLITDGVDHDRDGQLRQLDGLRAHGAALFAVGIASAVPAWISDRATQSVVVQTNDLDGASAKLDGVFSM